MGDKKKKKAKQTEPVLEKDSSKVRKPVKKVKKAK